jgi:hypothetical protein
MPEGIAVQIVDGYATIAPDPDKINDVVTALLATTPAELIETNTRSGPSVQYVVPEGNAREAGLIDEASLAAAVLDQTDLGPAVALVDADPNAEHNDDTDWHQPVPTVEDAAYVAGRNGENGILSGPLHVYEPSTFVPPRPEAAEETIEELRARVQAGSVQPADYAPKPSTPVGRRVPTGQATVASVITDTPVLSQQQTDPESAPLVPLPESPVIESESITYDDGFPDADWTRKALDGYALARGIDAKSLPNKQAVLDAINAAKA